MSIESFSNVTSGVAEPSVLMILQHQIARDKTEAAPTPSSVETPLLKNVKSELLYSRYNTKKMSVEEVKVLIWRYFIVYWNNRRICSANDGLPPAVKRKQYYDSVDNVA